MKRRDFLAGTAVTAATFTIAGRAFAQWTPRGPITAVVPYGAGGGTDTIARALVGAIGDALPVPVVVVNQAGSSGMVGAISVANGRADGNTILITSAGSFVLNSVMRDLEVDPIEDFVPIAQIGDLTTSLMVPANSPFQSVQDLVAAAQANPGSLRWSHTGRGSFHHVAGEGFLRALGLSAVDVPFDGGGATRAAVIGGQVDFGMIGIQQVAGFEAELRPLALVSETRDPSAPDVPTFPELGFDVPIITSPIVIFAPAGTPADALATLGDAVATAAASPAFAELMANGNNTPAYLNSADTLAKLTQLRDDARGILDAQG
jgi:tripartite-type tricarboxylate transporter receptor subunit TctC